MEIFVGFYMRRWPSPCFRLEHQTETLKNGFFSSSDRFLSFLISYPAHKSRWFSAQAEFEEEQPQE